MTKGSSENTFFRRPFWVPLKSIGCKTVSKLHPLRIGNFTFILNTEICPYILPEKFRGHTLRETPQRSVIGADSLNIVIPCLINPVFRLFKTRSQTLIIQAFRQKRIMV